MWCSMNESSSLDAAFGRDWTLKVKHRLIKPLLHNKKSSCSAWCLSQSFQSVIMLLTCRFCLFNIFSNVWHISSFFFQQEIIIITTAGISFRLSFWFEFAAAIALRIWVSSSDSEDWVFLSLTAKCHRDTVAVTLKSLSRPQNAFQELFCSSSQHLPFHQSSEPPAGSKVLICQRIRALALAFSFLW